MNRQKALEILIFLDFLPHAHYNENMLSHALVAWGVPSDLWLGATVIFYVTALNV